MGNRFNRNTNVMLRPPVCRPSPPGGIPVPVPPAQLCLTFSGTWALGNNSTGSMGSPLTRAFQFLAPATRTYVFTATLTAGGGSFNGNVRADDALCCGSSKPILAALQLNIPVTSSLLTANSWYNICISNIFGVATYQINIA